MPLSDRNDLNMKGTLFGLILLVWLMVGVTVPRAAETDRGSFEHVKAKAEAGDAEAQFELSRRYYIGEGTAKDLTEAVKWLRKAAENGLARAQGALGSSYFYGEGGVPKDNTEAVKWFRRAAEQGLPESERDLGNRYLDGQGVTKDEAEAVKWYRKAVSQGFSGAQLCLGLCYFQGRGVKQNKAEAAKWFLKAAEQGEAQAQYLLGWCYATGEGVPKDDVEGYKWCVLAAAGGFEDAKQTIAVLENRMSRYEIVQGQKLAQEFKPSRAAPDAESVRKGTHSQPRFSGTGFFITDDGYAVTNQHVAAVGADVRIMTAHGTVAAKVIKSDDAIDLALLKVDGKFAAIPIISSRSVRLGDPVVNVGFPNIDLQGFAPKFARGEIASLAGPADDARYFQISVPVQPGNSGGALVDQHGNVVGVVSAKLSAKAALLTSGALPENVNYAIKSSFLLSFLESVPEVSAKLRDPNVNGSKSGDFIEQAKDASVLVLVY